MILAILFLPFPRTAAPALRALSRDTHYSIDTASYGANLTVLRWHPQPVVNPARDEPLTFAGWAIDDAAARGLVTAVDAVVDGSSQIRGQTGLARPDVAAFFHNQALAPSGFRVLIPPCTLAAGAHRIAFRFEAADGLGYYRSRDDVDVDVIDAPAAAREHRCNVTG